MFLLLLQVVLASHAAYEHPLAVKFVKKRCQAEQNKSDVLAERQVLEMARHNVFCTHLFGAFQTNVSNFPHSHHIQRMLYGARPHRTVCLYK